MGTQIGASGRNLGGLGVVMTSSRCAIAFEGLLVCLLDSTLGFNSCKAFLTSSRCAIAFEGPLVYLLEGILGSNDYKAFRLALALSCEVQQAAQIASILLLEPAEGSLKKEERGHFW